MAACGRRSLRGTHGPLFLERGRAEIRVVPWCAALPALIPGCEWDPRGAKAGRAGNSFSPVSGSQAAGGDGGTTRSRGLSCSSRLEPGTSPGTFSLSRALTGISRGSAVCPSMLPPAPCSSLVVTWKDI